MRLFLRPVPAFLVALAACSQPADPDPPVETEPAVAHGAGPAAPVPTDAAARVSLYTSLRACRVVEQRPDEDWSTSRCPGLGGWALRLDYADARDDLALVRGTAKPVTLGLAGLGPGGFNSLGDTVEWRGRQDASRFVPDAVIVRNRVVIDPKDANRTSDSLVVIALERGCIVGQVPPQPGQNDAARQIADATGQACLTRQPD